MAAKVTLDGKPVTVLSNKSGWANVRLADKTEKKVRTNKLVFPALKVVKAKKVRKEGEDDRLVPADLEHYVVHDTKTEAGRRHIDIDDDTAKKMREKTLDQVYSYAAKILGEEEKALRTRYKTLNVGMQRMNLGNRVRAAIRAVAQAKEDMAALKKAA